MSPFGLVKNLTLIVVSGTEIANSVTGTALTGEVGVFHKGLQIGSTGKGGAQRIHSGGVFEQGRFS